MKARKIVDEMDSYVPGRSQGEIAEQFNLNKDEIIKLGSNENPWGPSPKAMKAIEEEISSINRYPESQLKELVAEIGAAGLLNLLNIETLNTFTNSVAYIQSWIKKLKDDTKMIVQASSRAEKAIRYIIIGKAEEEKIEGAA